MKSIARVAVNVPTVSGVFDYEIPSVLIGQIQAGCLVTVPFGQQVVQGIVAELADQSQIARLKTLIDRPISEIPSPFMKGSGEKIQWRKA